MDARSAAIRRWGQAKALSIPPGEYAGNGETQRNRRGPAQAEEHVVEFDDTRGTLPGLELLRKDPEMVMPFGASVKVLHGCRQLVP